MKFSWNPKWTTPALFVGGILLGAAAATAALFVLPTPSYSPQSPPPVVNMKGGDQPTEPTPTDNDATTTLNVDWDMSPRRLDVADARQLLSYSKSSYVSSSLEFIAQGLTGGFSDEPGYQSGLWQAGTVHDGEWKDATVYILRTVDGPTHMDYNLLRPASSSTIYAIGMEPDQQSNDYLYQNTPLFYLTEPLPHAVISGLDMPDTLTTTEGVTLYRATRVWSDAGPYRFQITEPLKEIAKTTDGRTVYQRQSDLGTDMGTDTQGNKIVISNGCFSVFASNGLEYVYTPHIALKETTDVSGNVHQTPDITWMPGYEHAGEYTYMRTGGCGNTGCLNIISDMDLKKAGELVRVGRTGDGDDIFAAKNQLGDPSVKAAYDSWYDVSWGADWKFSDTGKVESSQKPPMSDFLKKYPVPVFYWKDAFGRWVAHKEDIGGPPVECGKPVIYLYPEKTEAVSVRLPSFINVTVSDPSYPVNGWNVTAQPNGTLTDSRDGKTYSSLYWEGTGVGYVTPTDGWVIKDSDVETFLGSTLPKYGLNAQETKDFMDFWVPKMHAMHAPNDRVSFLTSEWSKAAPLFVSPRPTTAIRIFMDWKPLSAPIEIAAPKIVTPPRDGFTLVEWGGTLWK